MGILIKGMDEIPEDGAVLVVKHDNGKAYIKHACTYGYSMELVKLPAVQPDHVADIGKKVSISKVIRCKDCKFAHITNDGRYCKYCDMFTDDYGQLIEMYFDSNFYCGYAERRTDGQSKSD